MTSVDRQDPVARPTPLNRTRRARTKARKLWLVGFGILAGIIASAWRGTSPTLDFATEQQLRNAAPPELLTEPPHDQQAESRYQQIVAVCRALVAPNISLDDNPSPLKDRKVATATDPLVRYVVRLVGEGPLEVPSDSFLHLASLHQVTDAMGNKAYVAGLAGDSLACAQALIEEIRYASAVRQAGGDVVNYLTALSCDMGAMRNIARCVRKGWLRSTDLRRVLRAIQPSSSGDPDLANALRREERVAIFGSQYGVVAAERTIPHCFSVFDQKTPNAGNFNALETERQAVQLFSDEIQNALKSWPDQDSRAKDLVEQVSAGLPEDPTDESVFPDIAPHSDIPTEPDPNAEAAKKWELQFDALGYRVRMNRIANSFGRKCVAGLSFDSVGPESVARSTEHELVRTLIAIQLFRNDHAGAAPNTLQDLVSAHYLQTLPTDFYTEKPLHYNPSKGVLYSTGPDMKDHGGTLEREASWLDSDFGFFLKLPLNRQPH